MLEQRSILLAIVWILFAFNVFEQLMVPSCLINVEVSAAPTVSYILPEKVYVIYGLESSGTTFLAKTIALALNISQRLMPDTVESLDKKIHIQHLSLPLGSFDKESWGFKEQLKGNYDLEMIPVYYPTGCRLPALKNAPPLLRPVPNYCKNIMGGQVMTPPGRYFVNITSHVNWYRERGVQVYPIMMVRDPLFHFSGVLKAHISSKAESVAFHQYEVGREIMAHSIQAVRPTIVSYETMMTLKHEYLQQIFKKLDIKTSYSPSFRNGNLKYVRNYKDTSGLNQILVYEEGPGPRVGMPPRQSLRHKKPPNYYNQLKDNQKVNKANGATPFRLVQPSYPKAQRKNLNSTKVGPARVGPLQLVQNSHSVILNEATSLNALNRFQPLNDPF